MQFCITSLF